MTGSVLGGMPNARLRARSVSIQMAKRRKRLGLSQGAVAGAIGVHRNTLHRWEVGFAMPSLAEYIAWALELERCRSMAGVRRV